MARGAEGNAPIQEQHALLGRLASAKSPNEGTYHRIHRVIPFIGDMRGRAKDVFQATP
jgi:hypothetical protein